ncbi:MAG: helix-turn-helix transcriptional regulator [Gammaproteobacteria bacterium]|nr:helix-turn-helix transcriptional regulator [Gammaproteobacteria bacterium]
MIYFTDSERETMAALGARLRASRIASEDDQRAMAARIGVSTPTYRRMEQGDPATPLGYWIRALRLLDSPDKVTDWFPETLQARYEREQMPRQRMRRRRL